MRLVVATARLHLGRARRHKHLVGGLPRGFTCALRGAIRGTGSLLGHPGDLIGRERAPIGLVRGKRCDLGQALGELGGSRRVSPLRQQLFR